MHSRGGLADRMNVLFFIRAEVSGMFALISLLPVK
jgi:hypothetical protein